MEYLNETSVGDLLKIIDAFGQLLKTEPESGSFGKAKGILMNSTKNSKYTGSISSQANKLVMTFPVLTSNTINISTASMISKAIERKCTLMVQQIFAADIMVAASNTGGIQHKINNVYTGIDFDTLSVDDMINITNTITAKDGKAFFEQVYLTEVAKLAIDKVNGPVYESSINSNSLATFKISGNGKAIVDETMIIDDNDDLMHLTEAKKSRGYTVPDDFYDNLSNFGSDIRDIKDVSDSYNRLNRDQIKGLISRIQDELEDPNGDINYDAAKNMLDALGKANDISKNTAQFKHTIRQDIKKTLQDIENHKLDVANYDLNRRKIDAQIDYNNKQLDLSKKNADRQHKLEKEKLKLAKQSADQQRLAGYQDYFKKQLMDTDVKKANELVPSMLVVNYAVKEKDEVIQSTAIVGIKTRLIPMDSFDILDRLAAKNTDKSGFVKFIRATTGEIKFMKDFVLAIDKAKIDVLNKTKRGSANQIWKVLERRAAVNNLRKALGQKNDASPITTLVITQEEVDYLRKNSGMDLNNVNTANYILNSFNLLAICIVDEAAEVAKFLFDGEFNQYDYYSFTALEKEAGDNGMYKKVINLMSKRM